MKKCDKIDLFGIEFEFQIILDAKRKIIVNKEK